MKISELGFPAFQQELQSEGVWFRTGPFTVHLKTSIEPLARTIHQLYADFPVLENHEFADFHVRLATPRSLRRWYHPQVLFYFDDELPFKPLPLNQAFAMFEWCMNWCVSSQAFQYLIIHAAIIENRGLGVILAAPPGSGKSTLAAGLVTRGWRLLSDELTLINPSDGSAVPLARPVGLKNQSIEIIRNFERGAVIGPVSADTTKGAVAHLKPPVDSVARMDETATPRWVIFPKFEPHSDAVLTPCPKGSALLRLADNAFNYSELGAEGFQTLSDVIDGCDCYEFTYSRLDDAIATFDSLSSAASLKR